MRNPFYSEQDAFRFVLLVVLAMLAIALAAAVGPTWLALVVLALVLGAVATRWARLRMRKLRGLELAVKMAPPHVGSAAERRVLVVANDTLGEDALLSELERLASTPDTRVLVLAPALISPTSRLTGAVDGLLDQTRVRLQSALDRVGHESVLAGETSQAEPLEAIEDVFATFSPDEVIVATRWEHAASGLAPQLASLVRERFAVPVRHLVFEQVVRAEGARGRGDRRRGADVDGRTCPERRTTGSARGIPGRRRARRRGTAGSDAGLSVGHPRIQARTGRRKARCLHRHRIHRAGGPAPAAEDRQHR
jgi:hypothetical protein